MTSALPNSDFGLKLLWIFLWAAIAAIIALTGIVSPQIGRVLAIIVSIVFVAAIRWNYHRLVIVLLVVLSAIGLPNKLIAIQLANGDNLFGIRDVLILAVIVVGLITGRDQLAIVLNAPLLRPGLWLTALLPIAVVNGLLNSGSPLMVAREMIALSTGWLLALSVAANLRDWNLIKKLLDICTALGLGVAAGAALEIVTGNSVKIVSQYQQTVVEGVSRNFPEGIILVFFAASFAAAGLLSGDRKWKNTPIAIAVCLSFLLLQTRFYLVSYLASIYTVLVIARVTHSKWLKTRAVIPITAAAIVAMGTGAYAISRMGGSELLESSVQRYQDIIQDAGDRIYELEMVTSAMRDHPVLGTGLGVAYREVEFSGEEDIFHHADTFVHVAPAYFLLKFGPLGLMLFVVFGVRVVMSTAKVTKLGEPTISRKYLLAIHIFLLFCLIEALAANLFGDVKLMPAVGVILGIAVALQNLPKMIVSAVDLG
nr:hypothetical protein Hi04_10k_c4773_00028 [uncultured bacterium]